MKEERCPICLESLSVRIAITPCKHPFHVECIQNLVRPKCPLCQHDISKFLQDKCGVTEDTMKQRYDEDTARISVESLNMFLLMDNENNNNTIGSTVLTQMVENWGNWFHAFYSVIIDRVYDARAHFSEISMARSGEGFFVFVYNIEDVYGIIHDPWYPSRGSWVWGCNPNYDVCYERISDARQQGRGMLTNLMNVYYRCLFRKEAHSLVGHSTRASGTDFGVMIVVKDSDGNNHIKTRLLSTNEERNNLLSPQADADNYVAGNNAHMRIDHNDIICSLVTAQSHRSGHNRFSPNPDYTWAHNYLKRMKKRMRKKTYNNNRSHSRSNTSNSSSSNISSISSSNSSNN